MHILDFILITYEMMDNIVNICSYTTCAKCVTDFMK